MKLRTLEDFQGALDAEFGWRLKELSTILPHVKSALPTALPMLVRAGTALLYAHWEGFVRAGAEAYLSFVQQKKLNHDQLCTSLLSVALRGRMRSAAETNDSAVQIAFVEFLRAGLSAPARLPAQEAVKARSNLNSERMRATVLSLGLDYSPYELKENLIDRQLLKWRNEIAHGQFTHPSQSDYLALHDEVTHLLRAFRDQLDNAAATQAYRKPQPSGVHTPTSVPVQAV